MLISPWIKLMKRAVASCRTPSPRRRQHYSISVQACQIEQFETRAMLSAAGVIALAPPVIALAPPGPLSFTENSGPVAVAPGATVTDTGVTNFAGGTLTESITANAGATDTLAIMNQGNAAGQIGVSANNVQYGGVTIGTMTGGTGATPLVVTFNSNATLSAVQALQDAITFQTGDDPTAVQPRTFQSVVTNGPAATGTASAPVTETINIVEANPTVALNVADRTVSNSAALVIAPDATITSAETHNLAGGVLTVSLTNGTSRDQLVIGTHEDTAQNGVSVLRDQVSVNNVVVATFSGGKGSTPLVITFNSAATLADAQAIARSITFRSIGHLAGTTSVQFQLTDGDGGVSNIASTTFTMLHGHNGVDAPGDDGNGDGNSGEHGGPGFPVPPQNGGDGDRDDDDGHSDQFQNQNQHRHHR